MLILQGISLRLAVVNNSFFKNAQRGKKKGRKRKKIKLLKFFHLLMNEKHSRACVNTNDYGQLLFVTAFFIISVMFSQSTVSVD